MKIISRSLKLFIMPFPIMLLLMGIVKGDYIESTSHRNVYIELEKMDVFYIEMENPINIYVPGYKLTELKVSINNGDIVGNSGSYFVRPRRIGDACITISYKNEVIAKKWFRVKKGIKGSIALVSNSFIKYCDGNILMKKDSLKKVNRIIFTAVNSDYDLSFNVLEFKLTGIVNGQSVSEDSKDGIFTNRQLDIIRKVNIGSYITLSDIKVKTNSGEKKQAPTIIVKLI